MGLLAQFPAPLKAQAPAGLKSREHSPCFSGARGTARPAPTHPHPTTHPTTRPRPVTRGSACGCGRLPGGKRSLCRKSSHVTGFHSDAEHIER
ncbi:hypothetical protein F3K20_13735 [Streptomyces scabiei]|nr:hypothetical protein [Streptomyces sp. LBUM 1484]MBP5867159.1 hypothetical protein [Streptomyces sp. LBUM 1485]MBP5875513.1 hypothetical protein [Streptomyces sp. LBUM 1477]MBP5883331.1 hypothetical protein [Streptomyces sp. LBUM 1487]MBP5893847.1 hypothetical protein [Streptomyces sp. LBUM 1481]MBP5899354.1 hypothetical protein [Streptomyces sp. LBUM 1488]MBP5917060.1 hypothetical protein [Streptomyces sp. LBUM 1486]MBP5924099.1 hypothetical protein [Streptomyces sp. LBUM 1483]MBP593167